MDDVIRAHDGSLVLYKREGLWQARIHLGKGKYLNRSLKTANTEDAKRSGDELWHNTRYELSKGLVVQKRSVAIVLDEYVRFREHDNKMGKNELRDSSMKYTSDEMLRQIKRVQKFWREYAGKRAIDAIDRRALSEYVPWRKTYYHGKADVSKRAKLNPTDKTLQWEMMFMKMVLRWAKEDRGYLGDKPLPEFSVKLKTKRVRPDFTLAEFHVLKDALIDWHAKSKNEAQKAARALLQDYVLTLALSGIRIGEANNLKVRDVQRFRDDFQRENIQLRVRGKTGERTVTPHVEVKDIIEELLARRQQPDGDAWLFPMPNGERITSLRDQFDLFMKEYKLTYSSTGSKRSLYSLRHFYAVRAFAWDIGIYDIARNMGTSVQIIEDYYGKHAMGTAHATKLGGKRGEYQRGPSPLPTPVLLKGIRRIKRKTSGKVQQIESH